MDTKLIIVDGHCSVGKSTTSKSVFQQINLHQPASWLHEECENHPIRQDEFTFGRLDTPEGMELNRAGMLAKWTAFRDAILVSGKTCITEGCLLHAYDRYFIHSLWDENEIFRYYSQVIGIIADLNPLIVFLHRPDLRKSLENAFTARGDWWRELMLKRDDRHVYFRSHNYVDENSMFDTIAFEQDMMHAIFDRLQCQKLKIDTSAGQWDVVVGQILSPLGLTYQPAAPHPCDLAQYTGTYRLQDGSDDEDWIIRHDGVNRCLYTTLFWPYMAMQCVAKDVFELISFPAEMRFQRTGAGMTFSVHGNYDWGYNDRVLIRVAGAPA